MREFNHWKEYERENKRKDKLDLIIFILLIIGGALAIWIL